MNAWMWTCFALIACMIPSGFVALYFRNPIDRLIGLGMATAIAVLAFMSFSMGARNPSFIDLALVVSVLSFGGSLVFARFLERWD